MGQLDHEAMVANNRHQIEEALGSDNRYFFHLTHPDFGREPTDTELMFYYIENGGAAGHRQRLEQRDTA